ncbi:MAG: hypothetical protein A2Y57_02560 [Candidatus Woykebacteria bacterium RBG_13_40_7b]|uniref:DUF1648 domain-containing protein n=1 Tax=Candidatus Woykebacteria bacterium RBG_13_40_7b TaxID=1802594 RepID=A0A1G1WBH4_9BACT|nr:MAG: hypothetical protein A2Y57_02560 [Candidatus Woykebacteria bacterium RBG_13_40_7b]
MKKIKILISVDYLPSVLGTALFLVQIILILTKKILTPKIPLWYSKSWGLEQLAGKEWVWIIPVLSALIILLNFAIAKKFFNQELFISRFLNFSSLVVSLLLTITLWRILLLVS